MQDSIAITVENLGKKYRIGSQPKMVTLRDQMDEFMHHPFGFGQNKRSNTDFWALKNISFNVKKGDVLGVIGKNGSGKSTLLKILARIVEPTTGKALLSGRVASLLEVGTGFNQELTGRENTYLNGSILGMSKKEIDQKFNDIVEFSGVDQFIDTPVKRYSSGMYVRLAFAVAAHLDSDILLVDEVLAVGDMEFQKKSLGKMGELAHSGKTVIFVSHDMGKVRQLCSTGLLLKEGKIIKSGSTVSVCQAYESEILDDQIIQNPTSIRQNLGNQKFYISKIELRDTSDQPKSHFDAGNSMNIHLWLSKPAPANSFTVEIQLLNTFGKVISFAAANPVRDVYFNKEDTHIVCSLIDLPLTSGDYHLSFSVRIWGQERWDTWENAISFTIDRSDLFHTGFNNPSPVDGDFVINQQWKALP